jgi:uncharacterized phiE125 gp8 family phage protein
MGYKIITQASAVITTADLKAHLRVDYASDDSLIDGFLLAAMSYAQHYTGIAVGRQTIEMALDSFPDGAISLPLVPAASIISITYVDSAGAVQTLAGSAYSLDDYSSQDAWVVPAVDTEWPETYDAVNAVKVQYYAGTTALDRAIKQALLLLVGHFYENRQEATDKRLAQIPLGVSALLDTVKVWRV